MSVFAGFLSWYGLGPVRAYCARFLHPACAVVVVCALTLAPAAVRGQSTLVLEARAGVSAPVGSFSAQPAGGELSAAPTIGVHFALRRGARTYVYLGFAQARFDCAGEGCAGRWVSTQWDAGVRIDLGPVPGPVVPWLRLGVLSPSVEGLGGGERGDAPRGWGGEAGAGARIRLTDRLSASPGARFVAADVSRGGAPDLRMRYFVVDLGLVVGF